MEKRKLVLTAIGPDRPGLVKAISSIIHDSAGNLEDSRMAVLAGDFALIVLFSGSLDTLAAVRQQLADRAKQLGLQASFREPQPSAEIKDALRYDLDVTGVDQPGIVLKVSELLAAGGINVQSLDSRLTQAAFHGTEMFSLSAELLIPSGFDVEQLESDLDRVCEDLHLSYDLCEFSKD